MENNLYAVKEMMEYMLEAICRKLWIPPNYIKEKLEELYIECEGELEDITYSGK